jgi:hypothetical protein
VTLPLFFEVPPLFGSPLLKMVVSSSLDSTLSTFLDEQAIASTINLTHLSAFSSLILEIFSNAEAKPAKTSQNMLYGSSLFLFYFFKPETPSCFFSKWSSPSSLLSSCLEVSLLESLSKGLGGSSFKSNGPSFFVNLFFFF